MILAFNVWSVKWELTRFTLVSTWLFKFLGIWGTAFDTSDGKQNLGLLGFKLVLLKFMEDLGSTDALIILFALP